AATFVTVLARALVLVAWYVGRLVVVLDGKGAVQSLRASCELTRGFAWRVAVLLFVARVLFQLAGALLATPLVAVARSIDSEAMSLAGAALGETLVAAPLGIFAALLYFDLRSRKGAVAG